MNVKIIEEEVSQVTWDHLVKLDVKCYELAENFALNFDAKHFNSFYQTSIPEYLFTNILIYFYIIKNLI